MCFRKFLEFTQQSLSEIPAIGGIFKPKPKIAVLRMAGIIADGGLQRNAISYSKFEALIEEAFDIPHVKAVSLIINSPGGSAAQSALIGSHLRRLSEKKDIPVLAFIEDVAASGGYWLACAADEIYGQDVSIVGSIGVISSSFGFQDLIEKYGIERRVQTAGKEKSFMDPFQKLKPQDEKRLKTLQKELHESFISWVSVRRGEKLKGSNASLFEGQFWSATSAVEKGIIDGIGDVRSICDEKYGENLKYINITPSKGLIASLLQGEETKLSNLLHASKHNNYSLGEDIVSTIEAHAHWKRFGL